MKVYIHKGSDGECANVNAFVALDGFRQLGWEILFYQDIAQLKEQLPEEVVVGGISDITKALAHFQITLPAPLDYPYSLHPFLGRQLWPSTLHTFAKEAGGQPVFIKPMNRSKAFTGKLITAERDLIGCYDYQEDMDIWCAEPVKFLSEWRCFVRYGHILDVRRYRGDWELHYDAAVIAATLQSYTSAPKAFALDFGITDKGETLLVEANDGYSLGAYGLNSLDYAKLLSARWAELTGSIDFCDF
ncbi:ATP-grasp domain-containing protein [Chitinophaga nivalis]|uniref:ATP-grasp domain-containing protein n=1 Tax=Chitinophaga nivalis TaxID=2991709 RepID=A0ABT3IJT2_9BACT|nr:ATP-grasp domain-containing protein [Chitinophaga nivalis]MCW3466111.1 ATP-grasp domain-containing protein [Chitinophaga nivalis]MCW3484198.1 ATP-grasp domain-containing protein [Chitinophaga nivalis]